MTLTQPAWGLGLATFTDDGQVLDVWFPAGKLGLGRREADPDGAGEHAACPPVDSERCSACRPERSGRARCPG